MVGGSALFKNCVVLQKMPPKSSDYEKLRDSNIQRNVTFLQQLGIDKPVQVRKKRGAKRKKEEEKTPTRQSSRKPEKTSFSIDDIP